MLAWQVPIWVGGIFPPNCRNLIYPDSSRSNRRFIAPFDLAIKTHCDSA